MTNGIGCRVVRRHRNLECMVLLIPVHRSSHCRRQVLLQHGPEESSQRGGERVWGVEEATMWRSSSLFTAAVHCWRQVLLRCTLPEKERTTTPLRKGAVHRINLPPHPSALT